MPRTVEVTLPSEASDALLEDIQGQAEGIISLQINRQASMKPKGDVVTIGVSNDQLAPLMLMLKKHGIGKTSRTSVSTSRPISVISKSSHQQIITDSNESTWEEMDQTIAKESNVNINVLLLMFLAGGIAAYGIATNALHLVIGAMVIAPAFEPVFRISLGIISRSTSWRNGLNDALKAYAALIAGAAVAALLNPQLSEKAFGGTSSYLSSFVLLDYWSQVTASSVVVSALAAVAGALLIVTNRSVLTSGVMIALALVPATALVGVGLVQLDFELMGAAALRAVIDVVLVLLVGLIVLGWKRSRTQRRSMLPGDS